MPIVCSDWPDFAYLDSWAHVENERSEEVRENATEGCVDNRKAKGGCFIVLWCSVSYLSLVV